MTRTSALFAAIDVGSNATKMSLWDIGTGVKARERLFKRYPVRLEQAFRTGRIDAAGEERLVAVFRDIGRTCRRRGVGRVRAVATDAFRAAANGPEVARAIGIESGIALEILSAEQEGRLVAEGVMLDEPQFGDPFLILDIGGGSAEVILASRDGARTLSLPLGAVRLRGAYVRTDPIEPSDYEAMCRHVDQVVAREVAVLDGPWSSSAVGCGGGVQYLQAMCAVQTGAEPRGRPIRIEILERLCRAIWPMRIDSLVEHYGIDRERAEIIVPGAVVLLALMRRLGLVELRPSARGVRHGLLADFLRSLR